MKIETKNEAIHYFKLGCRSPHNHNDYLQNQIRNNFHRNIWDVFYNKCLFRIVKGHPQSLITEKGVTKVQEETLPRIIIFHHAEVGEPIKGTLTFELTNAEYDELELFFFGQNSPKAQYPKSEQPIPQEYIDKLISKETKLRSLTKAISWRILGTIDTMVVAYIISGEIVLSLSIGGLEVFTKIILYYLHERFWVKINNKWK